MIMVAHRAAPGTMRSRSIIALLRFTAGQSFFVDVANSIAQLFGFIGFSRFLLVCVSDFAVHQAVSPVAVD
jgi:hypothetical protein